MDWNWNAYELSSHPTYTYILSLVIPNCTLGSKQTSPLTVRTIQAPPLPLRLLPAPIHHNLHPLGPMCALKKSNIPFYPTSSLSPVLRIDSCLWPGKTEICRSWCCPSCHYCPALEGHISRKVKITFCDTLYPQRLAWRSMVIEVLNKCLPIVPDCV